MKTPLEQRISRAMSLYQPRSVKITYRQLYGFIAEHPDCSTAEVEYHTTGLGANGVPYRTLLRMLNVMERAGLVNREIGQHMAARWSVAIRP